VAMARASIGTTGAELARCHLHRTRISAVAVVVTSAGSGLVTTTLEENGLSMTVAKPTSKRNLGGTVQYEDVREKHSS
jgi:hypothetical protein